MKSIYTLLLISFFFASGNALANEVVSDEKISEITDRLEQYSTDALLERRDFLISY